MFLSVFIVLKEQRRKLKMLKNNLCLEFIHPTFCVMREIVKECLKVMHLSYQINTTPYSFYMHVFVEEPERKKRGRSYKTNQRGNKQSMIIIIYYVCIILCMYLCIYF